MTAKLVLDCADIVGESLVYDRHRNALAWVDIIGKRIHRLWLADNRHEVWSTPDFPTSIGLRQDGGAIVGLMKEVALWEFGGPFRTLAKIEPGLPGNRLNEGQVAPDGSFWVGTMQNNFDASGRPTEISGKHGALYRVAPDGTVTRLTPDMFGITNTLVWLDDGRVVTADSPDNVLYAYDSDGTNLTSRTRFFYDFKTGLPDGSIADSRGRIWNCRVTGGALAVIDARGKLVATTPLPCSWPTSCAFGGPDLDRLFVTSARFTMPADHLRDHPLEGGLFAIDPSVVGRPPNLFGPT
jgi:sugar lactone lactonase YvrE